MGDKCLGSVIEAFCKPRELPLAKGLRSLHNLFRLLKIKEDSSFYLTHSQRLAVALLAEWWTRSFEKMLDFVKKKMHTGSCTVPRTSRGSPVGGWQAGTANA